MRCPVCDREHQVGEPCKPYYGPGFIGFQIDVLKVWRWIKKRKKDGTVSHRIHTADTRKLPGCDGLHPGNVRDQVVDAQAREGDDYRSGKRN